MTKVSSPLRRVRRRHGRSGVPVAVAIGVPGFLAVIGPGLLAGLSDDDPAGITTYSILGAEFGYQLLWVLLLSTAALVVFHELAARMGLVTGCGLATLVRLELLAGDLAATLFGAGLLGAALLAAAILPLSPPTR